MSDNLKAKVAEALKAKSAEAKQKFEKAESLREAAEKEGFDILTDADAFQKMDDAYKEHSTVAQEVKELEERLARVADIDAIREGMPTREDVKEDAEREFKREVVNIAAKAAKRFAESESFKVAQPSLRAWQPGMGFQMNPVEIATRDEALHLLQLKTLVTGASNTSGGAFVFPDSIEGLYVDLPFAPNRIRALVASSTTDSDTVEYVEKTSRTNAAAETAEATNLSGTGAYAESAVAFAVRSVTVQDFGHWIPATARALMDEGRLQSILQGELVDGLNARLDGQLLSGDGNTPNIEGILTAVTQSQAIGSDSRSDAIHKAITKIRVNANVNDDDLYQPDNVVLYPSDYESLRLEKDANGNYIFGPPSQPGLVSIWGLPVVQSLRETENTGLVGAFRAGAELWIRSGISVAVTDSHASLFTSNVLVMKASFRAAFKTKKVDAFCEVTGI